MKLAIALLLVSTAAHAEPPGLTDPHDLAEARYQRMKLRLDDDFSAYRGSEPDPIDMGDFYREVGRPDLADKRHARRVLANVSMVGGGVLYGVMTYELVAFASRTPDYTRCDAATGSAYNTCWNDAEARADADAERHKWPLIGSAVGMVAAFTVATYLYIRPEPIDRDVARALATQHDRDLRYRMGLVPYLDEDGGGVTLTGAW